MSARGNTDALRARLLDARSSHGTTLALPPKPLTLDGWVCIHPECTTCRREQASAMLGSDAPWPAPPWPAAVTP